MKWFPLARMKDLLKNKFTLDGNKNFDYQKYLKNEKKKPTKKQTVSISQKIRFH